MQNSPIPLRDGYFIINTDVIGNEGIHWIAIVKQSHNIYVYDSFGRQAKNVIPFFFQKMIDHNYKIFNTDTSDADQHGYTSVDCGHRSISALMIMKKYGLRSFMSL